MDCENNGKPYETWDDLGVFPWFLETPKLENCQNQPTQPTQRQFPKSSALALQVPGSMLGRLLFVPLGVASPKRRKTKIRRKVSKNRGFYPPNHPILIGFSHYFHHPFWGEKLPLFLEGHPSSWWLNHPSEKHARQIGWFPQGWK